MKCNWQKIVGNEHDLISTAQLLGAAVQRTISFEYSAHCECHSAYFTKQVVRVG